MATTKDISEGTMQTQVASMVSASSFCDDAVLKRLGKKPVLKRSFNFVTALGFSCTVLVTWEGALLVLISGLQNGGPSGIVYGYILVWAGMFSLMATLSELVSMAPTSGGQYHWVSMLAPPSAQKFVGYMTGWLTWTGWQAGLASTGLLTGTMIQNLVALSLPEYQDRIQNWHGTLMLWAVLLLNYGINTAFTTLLGKFEGLAFVLHILGFFAIILPLVLLGEHASPGEVFNSFLNLGGWQTQGLSFCIGLLGNVFAFLGGDAAVHMSEEIHNAAVVVPWSLLATLAINGTLGFAMLLATLFCIGGGGDDNNDDDAAAAAAAAIADGSTPYPFLAVFRGAVGSTAGAVAMASVVAAMLFVAAAGCLASTSRVCWALARDRAVPGWRALARTSRRTAVPRNAVLAAAAAAAAVLALANAGDPAAFTGVVSVSVAAALLLWRRLRPGDIVRRDGGGGGGGDDEPCGEAGGDGGTAVVVTNTVGSQLTWGPWRIPGVLGVANNAFTCCFILFILFFSFWPTSREVTPQNMNWAALVTVVVFGFSILYYYVWARHEFNGPRIEI